MSESSAKYLLYGGGALAVIVIAAIVLWPRWQALGPAWLPAKAPSADAPTDSTAGEDSPSTSSDEVVDNSDTKDKDTDGKVTATGTAAVAKAQNATGLPLKLPDGFRIETFAKNLPGARVMALDPYGNLWVSQLDKGAVALLTVKDGKVTEQNQVLRGLNKPHGIIFDYREQNKFMLYVAEENKVSRLPTYSDGGLEKIADLPTGGRHTTRTLHWHPDGRLLVSIGSTCDVCNEQNPEHGSVIAMNRDGSNRTVFASGLRNAVFLTTNPVTGQVWVTEMGRDNLGDDLPPDEVNILRAGANYGWPLCYGKNIHDSKFDTNTYIRDPCADMTASHIDLPAHSAPLGLAFIPEDPPTPEATDGHRGWPEGYRHDLLVAYHGSWNRSHPTGYKIVRLKLNSNGVLQSQEDFITGWLTGSSASGRPVGLLVQPGGIMYISDDKAGVIYKVTVIRQ